MTLTENLVSLVRDKAIAEDNRQAAALFLLDALSSAYAGANTPVGHKLLAWAKSETLPARAQAYLMGALAHITETDDLHKASVAHPGCVVVPSVLAAAKRVNANGSNMLDATLRGFEVMCRIGRAVGPTHYKVWHNTATCGPFGSAMAVSELHELQNAQCVSALGSAGTQSSGLWQFLNTGAMSKHLHAGRASESGMVAAELAQHDFTGAIDILEGHQGFFKAMCPDAKPNLVLHDADAPWELLQTSIKPWPSCRHTHPAIDAALDLHQQLGNAVIEDIQIHTYQAAIDLCDRQACSNEYQAKFSLQHCVATALLNGQVALDSFSSDARKNAAERAQQTQVHLSAEFESIYPDAWGSGLTIKLADGRELSLQKKDCKGDPELPLTDVEMTEKALSLLRYGGLSQTRAQQIVKQVLAMPEAATEHSAGLMDDFLQHVLH